MCRLASRIAMIPHKAFPVVIRETSTGRPQILAFEHPQAGKQLVKGTIEADEPPESASLRELAEESGITNASLSRPLGTFEVGPPHQIWHAFVCEASDLEDRWTFFTEDDGGHEFRFFWHPIEEPADETWHIIFRQALEYIRRNLRP